MAFGDSFSAVATTVSESGPLGEAIVSFAREVGPLIGPLGTKVVKITPDPLSAFGIVIPKSVVVSSTTFVPTDDTVLTQPTTPSQLTPGEIMPDPLLPPVPPAGTNGKVPESPGFTTLKENLELPHILPFSSGKLFRRAPRGYVQVELSTGERVMMIKHMAKSHGLWKPQPKPPISVRDWSALKRAGSVIRKLKEIGKRAEGIANFKTTRIVKQKQLPAPKC